MVDFGKNIGTGVVDFGNGVVDIGKNIGKGVVDVGKTIAGGVIGVGKTIGDGVGKAIDGIKDLGSKIGGAFSSIFGSESAIISVPIIQMEMLFSVVHIIIIDDSTYDVYPQRERPCWLDTGGKSLDAASLKRTHLLPANSIYSLPTVRTVVSAQKKVGRSLS